MNGKKKSDTGDLLIEEAETQTGTVAVAETIAEEKAISTENTNKIYVGPTLQGIVKRNTVFSNGLPVKLQNVADKTPILKGLIIPVDELPDAQKQIRQKQGAIYTYYKLVTELKF